MQAMIFAAGLGTRLRPITDNLHKSLVSINGKNLLHRNIEFLQHNGINFFVINVFHLSEQIIDFLSMNKFNIEYKISQESPEILETGGGLKFAFHLFKPHIPIVTLNADILTNYDLRKLLNFHNQEKNFVSLAVSDRTSNRVLLFDEHKKLTGWQDTQKNMQKTILPIFNLSHSKAYSGISIFDYHIYKYFLVQKKFTLIELLLNVAQHEQVKFFEYLSQNHKFIDVGKVENIAKAEAMFV